MKLPPLRVDQEGGIATLTLSRPERGNALAPELVECLHSTLQACHDNPVLHTLVLRGEGHHFCTGLDLSDLDRCTDAELVQRLIRIEQLLDTVWRSPLRTVAVAQGRAWGAGADLFAACERRAARSGTTFRFPGARFGIVLGTRRLAERIGSDRARRAVIDGLELDAEQALAWGLATEMDDPTAAPAPSGLRAPVVDAPTARALRAATDPDASAHADADLAALVRSAVRPGLQARIQAYRDGLPATR